MRFTTKVISLGCTAQGLYEKVKGQVQAKKGILTNSMCTSQVFN